MLGKVLTPIVVAVVFYLSYQWYLQRQLDAEIEAYRKSKLDLKSQKETLSDYAAQFKKKQVVQVTDGIYLAIGYALGNSILLVGPEGLVIIDTTESADSAKEIFAEFRNISQKPVRAIVYTHNHADHILGTSSFLVDTEDKESVEIWSHHSLPDIFDHNSNTVGRAHYIRAMRQFGVFVGEQQQHIKDQGSAGIGGRLTFDTKAPFIAPNRFLYKDRAKIKVAGLELELIHIPGETDDQIAVYWPEKGAVFCADDFYKAFPNLYAIRGTPFRSLKLWTQSIDKMRSLKPEYLVPSHTHPIKGKDEVYAILTSYRDGIQFIHDQTVRFMNKGMHPEEIATRVRLPKSLESNPNLYEYYGTARWSVKGLYSGYMGWFSGDITELEPLTPRENSVRIVKLGGGVQRVLEVAEKALNEDDPKWALKLSSSVLYVENGNHRAKEIRAKCLINLAQKQTSRNGFNYFMTTAYETLGKLKITFDPNVVANVIRKSKISKLFEMMSLNLNGDRCASIDKIVHFKFTDTKQEIKFHARNGIWDLTGELIRSPDVNVSVSSVAWRELLANQGFKLLTIVTSDLSVEPGLLSLKEVLDCVEPI